MNDLHENQIALLKLLHEQIDNPLTIRQIQDNLNFSSSSMVAHHIQKLEQKGYLKRNPNNPRDYQVFLNPERPIIYLNLYGNAQCGKNGTILDGIPIDKIPIASRLLKFPAHEGFIVTAKGNSMEPFIKEGDLVIAQKKDNAENGEKIVCVYGEKVLIKRFFQQNDTITLTSLNSENHPPIIVADYFKIEGVIKNVLKYS
ncbi:MarR family transcriptional regulator [Hyunsoonleella sp. SJ7]|uniref:MarR family transcriptional regulator n=1 Tax=Hyunsoonleella aquatilis TaxID=2762758 RepID=A0A923HA12_9FLAO|nr:S24 family peptidase [Hyunsoonleella aquatilis]MBC3759243.1 MarR family transcriptional regulator [Hyunsoonleella aquatilis]